MTERRAPQLSTPEGYLQQLPSLVLLHRLPVATLAVTYEGIVVYANPACEAMLGYEPGTLRDIPVDEILADDGMDRSEDIHHGASRVTYGRPGRRIDLRHADGTAVRTVASESVLVRHDDPMSLVVFQDVTEELWTLGERT